MIKKLFSICLSVIMFLVLLSPSCAFEIRAEDPCTKGENTTACHIYRMNELKEQIASAQDDLKEATALANGFLGESEKLEEEINDLTEQIDELSAQIDELSERIELNEELVDQLNKRVLERMVSSQKSMHFNAFLDFILGSNGFADMLRRTYGIEAIMAKEADDRQTLMALLDQLKADKERLDETMAELDASRTVLMNKQEEYNLKVAYYNSIARRLKQVIDDYNNRYESEKRALNSLVKINGSLEGIPSSAGMIAPVPGARVSAGFPYYPASFGGGIHLGMDYAVSRGTPIYAPANGVVVVSYNGCASTGYLGCTCGGDGKGNGVAYGGNQVYIMVSAEDSNGVSQVYVVSFSHLQLDSIGVARGDIVTQGDYVARVGSSGNSTGPHCHIEVFYLGKGDMQSIQKDYLGRDYSSSFNCGWGSAGFNNICSRKGSAPCRVDPSSVF